MYPQTQQQVPSQGVQRNRKQPSQPHNKASRPIRQWTLKKAYPSMTTSTSGLTHMRHHHRAHRPYLPSPRRHKAKRRARNKKKGNKTLVKSMETTSRAHTAQMQRHLMHNMPHERRSHDIRQIYRHTRHQKPSCKNGIAGSHTCQTPRFASFIRQG